MTPLVQLTDVSKIYDTGPPALHGVSLSIHPGEALAVMGPSGSGKSTLLNLAAGLDRVTSGSVAVAGRDLTRLGEHALARFRRAHVGVIFQFFNLLENLTVRENIALPARLAGASGRAARHRVQELLERLGIDAVGDRYPPVLSGGERQRVAIARALVNQPALVLADEPTGALDTRTGAQVLDLLADLHRGGQTLVLVTHDPRLAVRCATRLVRLVDGAVVEDSTVEVRR
jgi:putative ABC transport system ATP-binding protein